MGCRPPSLFAGAELRNLGARGCCAMSPLSAISYDCSAADGAVGRESLSRLASCFQRGEGVLQHAARTRHPLAVHGIGVEEKVEARGMLADHLAVVARLVQQSL